MRFLGDDAGGASVSRKTILVGMVHSYGIRSKCEYYNASTRRCCMALTVRLTLLLYGTLFFVLLVTERRKG